MEEIKEIYIKGSIEPVSIRSTEIILEQMKKCVCQIHIRGTKGTGFFTKIPYKKKFLSVLMTNYHVLGEDDISNDKIISISLNNGSIAKNIKIDSQRKRYANEILDVTIIEIKEKKDSIQDFLILDNQIMETFNQDSIENFDFFHDRYKNESIYLLNYKNGNEIYTSYGILNSIHDNKISHKSNTDSGSSGSPILLLSNNRIIWCSLWSR